MEIHNAAYMIASLKPCLVVADIMFPFWLSKSVPSIIWSSIVLVSGGGSGLVVITPSAAVELSVIELAVVLGSF